MDPSEGELNNNIVAELAVPENSGQEDLNVDCGTRVVKVHPFLPGVREQHDLRSQSQFVKTPSRWSPPPPKKVVRFSSDTEITIIPAIETDSEGSTGSSGECETYFGSPYADLKDLEREEGLALKCSNEALLEESIETNMLLCKQEIEEAIKPIIDGIIEMAAQKCEMGDVSYLGWDQSAPPSECSEQDYTANYDGEELLYDGIKECTMVPDEPSDCCSILGQMSDTSFYHMYNYFANETIPPADMLPDSSPEWGINYRRPKSADSIDDEVDVDELEDFGKHDDIFENVGPSGKGESGGILDTVIEQLELELPVVELPECSLDITTMTEVREFIINNGHPKIADTINDQAKLAVLEECVKHDRFENLDHTGSGDRLTGVIAKEDSLELAFGTRTAQLPYVDMECEDVCLADFDDESEEQEQNADGERSRGICGRIVHFFNRLLGRQQDIGRRINGNDPTPAFPAPKRPRQWISKPARIAPFDFSP